MGFDKEWLERTVTISREQLGTIVAEQIARETGKCMKETGDIKAAMAVNEFLSGFGAGICACIFKDKEEDSKTPDTDYDKEV